MLPTSCLGQYVPTITTANEGLSQKCGGLQAQAAEACQVGDVHLGHQIESTRRNLGTTPKEASYERFDCFQRSGCIDDCHGDMHRDGRKGGFG
jgi:hypothetical protein